MKDEEMAEEYAKEKLSEEDYKLSEEVIKPIYHNAIKNDYSFAKYGVECYLAGLKAGRPQWHYVKDGDYPDTDRTVLAYSDDVVSGHYPYFAQYYKGFTNAKKKGVDLNWNCWRNNMQRELIEPTVWCEIPTFDKE